MNVAICLPTYNRPEVVEDTLSRGIEHYAKHGIDVYYYDGSTNDETRKVVQKYIDKGYGNIKYLYYPNPEVKRYALYYTGVGFEKEYDYVWPVKDRVWFEEPTIVKVKEAMEEGHDAIFIGALPCFSHPEVGTKIYEVPEEFYLDWGYLVTSIDVNIFKTSSMLKELTYDDILNYSVAYAQFDLMFSRLSEGKKTAKALVGNDIVAYNSRLVSSGWKKNAFSIWVDSWLDVNDKLPLRYQKYKEIVIKQAGMLPWIFGSVNSLIDFKNNGAFENLDMESLCDKWSRVSDISWDRVIEIANEKYDEKHDIDLLPNDMDALLNAFIEMAQYVRDGKLPIEKIPLNDVLMGAFAKAKVRCRNNAGCMNILLGSLEDILKFIKNDARTREEVSKALQLIITITMLSLPERK